jgi:riboflavin synthase
MSHESTDGTVMFTGIVEEQGVVESVTELQESARVRIRAAEVLEGSRPGDSIAVNGVCLTVVDVLPDGFTADVMKETLDRTSIGAAGAGNRVNLERAARLDSRIGGHLVQGHVDGVGTIEEITETTNWTVMRIGLPTRLMRYLAAKGSIAVDGVSLTVVDVLQGAPGSATGAFTVSLIPTTLMHTSLGTREVGDVVNLEVDVIAKYVERLLQVPVGLGGQPTEANGRPA